MSSEKQRYSIKNQQDAIREYAVSHGFRIVKTYADPGRTGVEATRRTALQDLLKDVVSGNAEYKAILVYDVSRWGRFQNNDEGAHYEFLCQKSGVPLHYCAEPFSNDGTAMSSLIKALKRSMAAEYSRELGEKVHRSKDQIFQLGFWVGGKPPFGYRRMMVSPDGKRKQLMQEGELKNIKTDRTILVPGPRRERNCIRLIFTMAAQGHGATAISLELNNRGMLRTGGKPWLPCGIFYILNNPKYYGCDIRNRTSHRLQNKWTRIEPQYWIVNPDACKPTISQALFEKATACRPKRADQYWSDEEILLRVRQLLRAKGRLSETILHKARGMPALNTIHRHFGTYRQLYEKVDFHLDTVDCINNIHCETTLKLRRKVVSSIQRLFPEHIQITHHPGKTRSVLLVDNSFVVSVVLCRTRRYRSGTLGWPLYPNNGERHYITLACKLNEARNRVLQYYLLERTDNFRLERYGDSFFRKARRLDRLSDFYKTAKQLWTKRRATQEDDRFLNALAGGLA
jgi:DNA invertase Pin-like site-specific DNA recombinase